jgi:hypothetical protein
MNRDKLLIEKIRVLVEKNCCGPKSHIFVKLTSKNAHKKWAGVSEFNVFTSFFINFSWGIKGVLIFTKISLFTFYQPKSLLKTIDVFFRRRCSANLFFPFHCPVLFLFVL